jgi:hypothetical protein
MRRLWIAAAAVVAATVGTTTALAVGPEKTAFAIARDGNLRVISSAIMLPSSAELRGGWLNEAISCLETRRLRVRIEVFYSRGQQTKNLSRTRTRTVHNCAEGGPNVGFTLFAKPNNFACPNGRWRPGDYSFHTRTTELASGLVSEAVLILTRTAPC